MHKWAQRQEKFDSFSVPGPKREASSGRAKSARQESWHGMALDQTHGHGYRIAVILFDAQSREGREDRHH